MKEPTRYRTVQTLAGPVRYVDSGWTPGEWAEIQRVMARCCGGDVLAISSDAKPSTSGVAGRRQCEAPEVLPVSVLLSERFCDHVLDELVVIAGGQRHMTDDRVPFARWDMKRALRVALEREAP